MTRIAQGRKKKVNDPNRPKTVWTVAEGGYDYTTSYLRSKDRFGQTIPLNYNGADRFNTAPGGFISIIVKLLFYGYMLLKFKYMVNIEEWKLTNQNVITPYEELTHTLNFSTYSNVTMGLEFSYKMRELSKEDEIRYKQRLEMIKREVNRAEE